MSNHPCARTFLFRAWEREKEVSAKRIDRSIDFPLKKKNQMQSQTINAKSKWKIRERCYSRCENAIICSRTLYVDAIVNEEVE